MTIRPVLAAVLACGLVFGAPAEPERLDLNTATGAQLEALAGIGPATAERIVRMRERNGPYRCVEELRAVPRLSQSQFETLRQAVEVRDADPRCAASEARRRAGKRLSEKP